MDRPIPSFFILTGKEENYTTTAAPAITFRGLSRYYSRDPLTIMEPFILFGIVLALGLAFVNGLNDASHSIATVVATRALSPAKAVFLTAICNMLGPFIFTTAVAATIGTAIVTKSALTPASIIVGMGSAILLIFGATRAGLPLSSSNAMIGGLMGAGVAVGGIGAIILPGTGTVIHVIFWGLGGVWRVPFSSQH